MGKQIEVEFEGKSGTVSEDDGSIAEGIQAFAKKHGLRRFIAKDADSGEKLKPDNIDQAEKIRLLRTEVAGA